MMCFTNSRINYMVFVIVLIAAIGCSGGGTSPVAPVEQHPEPSVTERDNCSERMLWGIWEIEYDPVEMEAVVLPARHLMGHFNITQYVLPPACDDCFNIAVKGFDTVTRILDADVTLRNPMLVVGHDVRGILYTNEYGHALTNADAWTGLWDIPGGDDINPFKAFAKGDPTRVFAAGAEHTEKYLLYIPKPPAYSKIQFAVDASWPSNCKEPYDIGNFIQDGELYDLTGSMVDLSVDVFDWQEDVAEVTIDAPHITGEPLTHFSQGSGNTWEVTLANNTGAPPGEYEVRLRASSFNAAIPLYHFVTITITESPVPVVNGIDPDIADAGDLLTGVTVTGENFSGPGAGVKLKMDGEMDIDASNVSVVDPNNITCDMDIPLVAALGLWDVEVTNSFELTGTGVEMFEITTVIPEVTGIDPVNALPGTDLIDISVFGSNFQGPGAQVTLKKDGGRISTRITLLLVQAGSSPVISAYHSTRE